MDFQVDQSPSFRKARDSNTAYLLGDAMDLMPAADISIPGSASLDLSNDAQDFNFDELLQDDFNLGDNGLALVYSSNQESR
jgi:hypothetical protein